MERDTIRVFVLDNVGADHLTPDVVWSVGDGRGEDGACHGVKDIRLRGVSIVVVDASLVVVDGLPFGEIGGIASFELGCAADSLRCYLQRQWSFWMFVWLGVISRAVIPLCSLSSLAMRARRSLFFAANRRAASVLEHASRDLFPA